jgi:anti-sigma factor RsiW
MSDILHRVRFWLDHRWAPRRMSDYLDADLSAGRRRRLERHVGECEACRRLLADLRTMLAGLRGLRSPSEEADAVQIAAAVRLRLGERDGPR